MLNYREQDGCHNCGNCAICCQQDEETSYYCNINKDLPKYNDIANNIWEDEKGDKRGYLKNNG